MGKMEERELPKGVTYLSEDPGAAQSSPNSSPAEPEGIPVRQSKTTGVSGEALSGSAMGAPEAEPATSSWAPHPKVAAGGLAGLVAIPLLWLVSLTGVAMPQEVALSLAGIIIWLAGFATPSE